MHYFITASCSSSHCNASHRKLPSLTVHRLTIVPSRPHFLTPLHQTRLRIVRCGPWPWPHLRLERGPWNSHQALVGSRLGGSVDSEPSFSGIGEGPTAVSACALPLSSWRQCLWPSGRTEQYPGLDPNDPNYQTRQKRLQNRLDVAGNWQMAQKRHTSALWMYPCGLGYLSTDK